VTTNKAASKDLGGSKVWANDAGTKRRTLDLLLNSQLLKQMVQETVLFYRIELNEPTRVRVGLSVIAAHRKLLGVRFRE
jgi:hypothetical protein